MNPDATIARLVHDQLGMVTRSQALDAGLSADQIDDRVKGGLLRVEFPAVYAHAAVPRTWRGRLNGAVLLTGPNAVASHRSAATLHGLRGVRSIVPEVLTTDRDHPRSPNVKVHRTTSLDDVDRTIVDAIRCTTVARTLLDLGGVLPYEVVELAMQDAVIRRLVTHQQLIAVLERVGRRGRRGTAALRAAVRHALPDERLESELERLLAEMLPPGFVLQYEMTCSDGRRVRLDSALPELRIAVETNGHLWHATRRDMERDLARRRSIQASGWTHYEYGWSDMTERAASTRAQLHSFFGALAG